MQIMLLAQILKDINSEIKKIKKQNDFCWLF